jgi:hypothetical protein
MFNINSYFSKHNGQNQTDMILFSSASEELSDQSMHILSSVQPGICSNRNNCVMFSGKENLRKI